MKFRAHSNRTVSDDEICAALVDYVPLDDPEEARSLLREAEMGNKVAQYISRHGASPAQPPRSR